MTNPEGREYLSMNGRWDVIVDLFSCGESMGVHRNLTSQEEGRFIEYSFDGNQLEVPGDWNSQRRELYYYESSLWYRRNFDYDPVEGKRLFLYFGAANYMCDVFLNGEKLGTHEGGFSPFEFEVTGKIKKGENFIIAHVNNKRSPDYIPAMKFDWWNYGGLTRDVYLIETPEKYIRDYTLRLGNNDPRTIYAKVTVSGAAMGETVRLDIPGLKISRAVQTDTDGVARFTVNAKPELWSPSNPKLYDVSFSCGDDRVSERIGFRMIETQGGEIFLNGEKIFLKGVNCHDEIPQRSGRSFSEADARMLLSEVKALGCNFLRLTHYPATEKMVRLAEEMGIMLWEEVPLWQNIAFSNPDILPKANMMLDEMINRDKNRCAVIMWSVANETKPGTDRNRVLKEMVKYVRETDPSRLVACAFSHTVSTPTTLKLDDPVAAEIDIIGINKYYGWYIPWACRPSEMVWEVDYGKPVIFSEFGSESLYGHNGDESIGYDWNEEYQARNYRDNIEMLQVIPNLAGTTPWVLYDFRSPYRMNSHYQQEWNRKGLISDKGHRKQAWYVLKEFYDSF